MSRADRVNAVEYVTHLRERLGLDHEETIARLTIVLQNAFDAQQLLYEARETEADKRRFHVALMFAFVSLLRLPPDRVALPKSLGAAAAKFADVFLAGMAEGAASGEAPPPAPSKVVLS